MRKNARLEKIYIRRNLDNIFSIVDQWMSFFYFDSVKIRLTRGETSAVIKKIRRNFKGGTY